MNADEDGAFLARITSFLDGAGKLEWRLESRSERQYRDAVQVAAAQGSNLDMDYLRHWAEPLRVSEDLEQILRGADELRPQ